jgi:hypothetical protein
LPRLGFKIPKTLWLRPQRSTSAEMIEVALLAAAHIPKTKPVLLNMIYHNVEVFPAASPYAATETDVQKIVQSQR